MQDHSVSPQASAIYFVTVSLNKRAHEKAHGFTPQVYRYAYASTPTEAECAVMNWLTEQGLAVQGASAGDPSAVNQNADAYTFPHQIINLPQAILDAVYASRGYPPTWRDPARFTKVGHMH